MMPVIQIGPAVIQANIFALLIALWFGSFVAERQCQRRGIDGNHVWNLIALSAATTLFAARLIFVALNWRAYADAPAQMFALSANGLALHYGILFGIFAAYAYILGRDLPFARFADALAPGVLVAIMIFAFGQFLSGDAYGALTDVPWATPFFGALVHPVQLYDALAAIIGLGIVWRVRFEQAGMSALFATAWYSAARVFIDAFRGDAMLIGNGYRLSQIVALVILLIALWFIGQKINWTQMNTDKH